METGWLVPTMGNTYSGSSPTGLAAVLDEAGLLGLLRAEAGRSVQP